MRMCMCSMWRIICLGFFGVFAWGVTWDMYGTRIQEHYHRVVDAVQAWLSLSSPFHCHVIACAGRHLS